MMKPQNHQTPQDFWEELYKRSSAHTRGKPSAALARFAVDRQPGTALDLGCAKGDDAVWLAKHGWQVIAVDISETVLSYARRNANSEQIGDRIELQHHDLAVSFPENRYDLVSAMFLQAPFDFPRERVLKHAALCLNSGGLFIAATHGSRPSWSWDKSTAPFPTPHQCLKALGLNMSGWKEIFVGNEDRNATGPEGQKGTVTDTIVCLERR
ncbi:class I SAM-dependent methyltransferase [Labrenzia sp. DG1229]|uniref:class I SAM-dependent methyltransferase n=1 Tax=Labrenzia sp. DG1229 TaxID=681847 RepID=UPI000A03D597|nr:class I SAM-dependent methyltransferase [Labrenzia sp. DG1229]